MNKDKELNEYRKHLKDVGYKFINDFLVLKGGYLFDIIYYHSEPHKGIVISSYLKLHEEVII